MLDTNVVTIPPQNLAIFLQKFTVSAPDALTFLSNYNSVGVMTTNAPSKRQWQFTFNGYFTSKSLFEIIYDFSQVDTYGYSITFEGNLNGFLTVDGKIYAADKYLLYIPQTPQDILNKIVRLQFKPPCPRSTTNERSLYYVTNINDAAASSCCAIVTYSQQSGTTWGISTTNGLDLSVDNSKCTSYSSTGTTTNLVSVYPSNCGAVIKCMFIAMSNTTYTFNISNLGNCTTYFISNVAANGYSATVNVTFNTPQGSTGPISVVAGSSAAKGNLSS